MARTISVKRYYLCDVIGNGSSDEPFRPKIEDLLANGDASSVASNSARTHAIVIVDSRDHSKFQGIDGIDPLPDSPLDAKISTISAAALKIAADALVARGLPKEYLSGNGYRRLLTDAGKAISPTFNVDKFDARGN